jgi:septal ring factor EnvC (AmiA/AmiB activator)
LLKKTKAVKLKADVKLLKEEIGQIIEQLKELEAKEKVCRYKKEKAGARLNT